METGDEVLARLMLNRDGKIDISRLEPKMFGEGSQEKQIVELLGEPGSGKTQYMYHMITSAVLPQTCGGLEVNVLLVDIDHSFCLNQLTSVIENRILKSFVEVKPDKSDDVTKSLSDALISSAGKEQVLEQHLMSSLSRLYVTRCSSISQLIVSLQYLESAFNSKRKIRLLFIDCLCSLFPAECLYTVKNEKVINENNSLKQSCEMIVKLSHLYNVSVILTSRLCRGLEYDSSRHKNSTKRSKSTTAGVELAIMSELLQSCAQHNNIPVTQFFFRRLQTNYSSSTRPQRNVYTAASSGLTAASPATAECTAAAAESTAAAAESTAAAAESTAAATESTAAAAESTAAAATITTTADSIKAASAATTVTTHVMSCVSETKSVVEQNSVAETEWNRFEISCETSNRSVYFNIHHSGLQIRAVQNTGI